MNKLYQIATDPNRTMEERWEAVRKMRELRKPVMSAEVAAILQRTKQRRRSA